MTAGAEPRATNAGADQVSRYREGRRPIRQVSRLQGEKICIVGPPPRKTDADRPDHCFCASDVPSSGPNGAALSETR